MWFNPLMASILRSPLHRLVSGTTMLMTVRGRKSGRAITTPVNYVRHGEDLLTVSFRSRTWWRNLRDGAPVECWLRGKKRAGTASVLEAPAEVERGLADLVSGAPSFARPLGIGLDAAGRPRVPDLVRAAQNRVIVRTRLEGDG